MDISNKTCESEKKDNKTCRDGSNRESLLLPVVSAEQPSPYLLSSLQINQEEALRGVSLEALSHIMQSSCHPTSSHYNLMAETFAHPPSTSYQSSSCTIQTYNNSQEKATPGSDMPTLDVEPKTKSENNCCVCKLNFPSASDLLSHSQTVHVEQIKASELSKTNTEFSTDQGKDFNQPNQINLSDQPKREMFPCETCGLAFESSFDLKAHSVKHTGSSHSIIQAEALRQVGLETLSHLMSSCHPTTSHFGNLMNASYNHPSSSYQATPCNIQPFTSTPEKASEAPTAEAVYSDDDERTSNNDIGVMCSVCKMSFPNSSQLLSHRRTVHRGQISCEFCGKNFANTHNLKIHSFSHTGDNRSKSFCNSCGKGFIKPSDLRRHELIHAGRYSCLECNITFNTADEVKDHSKTHEEFSNNCSDCSKELINNRSNSNVQERSSKESFTCDTCGLTLESKFDLKAHVLKHTGTGSSQNVCETCGKTFSRPSDLNRHSVIHTGQRPFTCVECNMSFGNQSNLRMHIMTHSDVKPHPCNVCEKSFRRSADLERHACTHSGERPFTCNVCPMAFTTSYNLKIHQLKHTGDLPYPCSLCEKAFSKPSELQRHNLIHTGERPFSCPQCGMNFSNSSNLRNHMITHSGRRPYPCNICKKAFTRPSDVKRHVLTHTGARPFACQICGLAFADSSNLKKHTLTHSKQLNQFGRTMLSPPFRCQVCDMFCSSTAELDSHVRDNHSDGSKEFLTKLNSTKQYTCAICGLRFAHAIHLQEHSLNHDREHSFQCEICDKSFAQELFLQRHLLTHTEARPYECPECFKCFKSSSHLKNHIPIHSGVKPFVCGTCNKAFLKNASLRRHQTIHARGNTVACNICGKSFLNMEYLKKHSITHES